MATDVIMPALGVAQEKGTLINWLKVDGDSVTKGEPLMEIETDKATVEVEAPASGILAQVSAAPGDEVPVGQRIAVILAAGETYSPEKRLPQKSTTPQEAKRDPTSAVPEVQLPARGGRLLASPAAKRIAREKGIDLASLRGRGPEGSILVNDVLHAAKADSTRTAGAQQANRTIPLSSMRRIVAQRMTQSKQTAPHFYLSVDVDMTAVNEQRAEWKNRGEPLVPSINDFILHTSARALKEFPALNSRFKEQEIEVLTDINIGMAVALQEGLVVPVIRHADQLSLKELAQQSRELIDKAQRKKLLPLDYEGGTFTVSNLGMLGVDSFVAIINPPQSAILAVGRVAPRVVADRNQGVIRPMMTATLSADHRVVDGASAARFLQGVKRLLESPEF
jgi:pyruvate dehydrogenase E2 component (dihydrolipoamide acetyltransferase)